MTTYGAIQIAGEAMAAPATGGTSLFLTTLSGAAVGMGAIELADGIGAKDTKDAEAELQRYQNDPIAQRADAPHKRLDTKM